MSKYYPSFREDSDFGHIRSAMSKIVKTHFVNPVDLEYSDVRLLTTTEFLQKRIDAITMDQHALEQVWNDRKTFREQEDAFIMEMAVEMSELKNRLENDLALLTQKTFDASLAEAKRPGGTLNPSMETK